MNHTADFPAMARAARAGDEAAIDRLARALWPNAYRIAWSILGDRHAAEDAAQAACTTVFRKLAALEDCDAFGGWAYRIVVSHARDRLRAHVRLCRNEILGYTAAERNTIHDDAATRLDLARAIGSLPEVLRVPLELRYAIGLTSAEIGRALGIPAATVRFRLMRARNRLRPLLRETTASLPTPETN